jgi:hypothetical protein
VTPLRVSVAVILLALGLRAALPAGWPAPFHPTVQYESALAARAIWLALDPSQRTPDRAGGSPPTHSGTSSARRCCPVSSPASTS